MKLVNMQEIIKLSLPPLPFPVWMLKGSPDCSFVISQQPRMNLIVGLCVQLACAATASLQSGLLGLTFRGGSCKQSALLSVNSWPAC